ncbi:MAG: TlpA disulfide reductase family protein [Deltaproteobacteria bacterium]|nr:TlpA disulfide reductase family protein [Deltaproteobacteria bacterium]
MPAQKPGGSASDVRLALGIGLALVVGMVALGWLTQRDRGASPLAGRPAPDFRATLIGGEEIRLSDYQGKVVLLNIWATWCKPCEEEAPSLERLYQLIKAGPGGADFEILAVSIDARSRDAVLPFRNKFSLTFPILFDPDGRVSRMYQTTGVPESFVVDRDGIIREKVIGPRTWDSDEMVKWFGELVLGREATKDLS